MLLQLLMEQVETMLILLLILFLVSLAMLLLVMLTMLMMPIMLRRSLTVFDFCFSPRTRHSSEGDGDFEVSGHESSHLLLCHAVLQKTSYGARSCFILKKSNLLSFLISFAEGGAPGKPVRAPASNLFTDGMGFDM